MDESALKELIASLGNQLSSLGWWMYFWTAMVILGCAGELFFVIHAYLDERTVWREARTRGAVALPEKPSLWVLILEVTSVALVVIGIAGELFVDWKSDDLQTRLRDANGSLVLKLEQSAGEAKESAKTAAKDATTAKVASAGAVADSGTALTLAKGARKEADSFEGDIKSAKTEAADAESHLAEARERAAAAETRVLELNAKLADRTLSDEQIKAIGAKLARYAGQEYDIVPYWDSPESVGIANRIQLALAAVAQWKYKPPGSWEGLMGGLVGIKVSVHPQADEATLAAAKDLTLALQNAGLEAKEELQNPKNPKSNAIGLSVGSKR